MLLKNLQKTNPQSYTNTIKWLERQNLDRETRLLLPEPSTIYVKPTTPYSGPVKSVPLTAEELKASQKAAGVKEVKPLSLPGKGETTKATIPLGGIGTTGRNYYPRAK